MPSRPLRPCSLPIKLGVRICLPCIFSESQRDSVLQPRVARYALPWESHRMINPNGVVSSGLQFHFTSHAFRSSHFVCLFHHSRRSSGHNPVGVERLNRSFPMVARGAQPWAMGRNPVGVLKSKTLHPNFARSTLWVMSRLLRGDIKPSSRHQRYRLTVLGQRQLNKKSH